MTVMEKEGCILTEQKMAEFERYLRAEGHQRATVEKYLRNVRFFASWLGEGERQGRLSREAVTQWKAHLQDAGYAPSTVNARLAALNRFFGFAHREECRVRFLHIQRRPFREDSRDLGRREYERLLEAARRSGQERLGLIVETIGSTGIRVSELAYITVEAARRGRATADLKGKVRTVLLPGKLRRKLLSYAKRRGIREGRIFRTRSGREMSRRQIWREMKGLGQRAGVEKTKVFPHNLRHLFATVFYKTCRDIVKLADVLGHSSIETTRIYLMTTGREHARQIERLRLVM